ncbi:MAG: YebC/PmpR family DNA-binding transcriptional regulator [Pseudomonadota bacterium]
MAGHSKFKNIMYRKSAQDKKRASLFAKLTREIIVAVKTGGHDPDSNNRLRLAIATARSNSMPKNNIERAIKRGDGSSNDDNYMDIRYEGYGPYGTAVIVECLSDNRNRTAADIRTIFAKANGSMGESNSVAFLFERLGRIEFSKNSCDEESIFEAALEAGAENIETHEEMHEILCADSKLHQVSSFLEQRFGDPQSVQLIWKPKQEPTMITDEEQAIALLKMVDSLEEHDDVQNVFVNFDIEESLMMRLRF